MGTDYPVKAHSLINAFPYKITPSKGILIASFKNTISPGTIYKDDSSSITVPLSTCKERLLNAIY